MKLYSYVVYVKDDYWRNVQMVGIVQSKNKNSARDLVKERISNSKYIKKVDHIDIDELYLEDDEEDLVELAMFEGDEY